MQALATRPDRGGRLRGEWTLREAQETVRCNRITVHMRTRRNKIHNGASDRTSPDESCDGPMIRIMRTGEYICEICGKTASSEEIAEVDEQ
jgi:hypothetical protein